MWASWQDQQSATCMQKDQALKLSSKEVWHMIWHVSLFKDLSCCQPELFAAASVQESDSHESRQLNALHCTMLLTQSVQQQLPLCATVPHGRRSDLLHSRLAFSWHGSILSASKTRWPVILAMSLTSVVSVPFEVMMGGTHHDSR